MSIPSSFRVSSYNFTNFYMYIHFLMHITCSNKLGDLVVYHLFYYTHLPGNNMPQIMHGCSGGCMLDLLCCLIFYTRQRNTKYVIITFNVSVYLAAVCLNVRCMSGTGIERLSGFPNGLKCIVFDQGVEYISMHLYYCSTLFMISRLMLKGAEVYRIWHRYESNFITYKQMYC